MALAAATEKPRHAVFQQAMRERGLRADNWHL